MPENTEISAEVAALKSGLGPFYGRLLGAAERIADALELAARKDEKLIAGAARWLGRKDHKSDA